MKTGTLRLRRVNFRDGRAPIEVFRSRTAQDDRRDVESYVKELLDEHAAENALGIAGFAFAVWGPDNISTATARAWPISRIEPSQVPDFVRERLMFDLYRRRLTNDDR